MTFVAALAYGLCLAEKTDDLVARIATFPRPLAVAIVRILGQLDHFWRWRMYRDRGNPHGLRTHFAMVTAAIIHLLCALNGRWWPGPKWPDWVLADLPIAPPGIVQRLTGLDQLAPAEAAAEPATLVDDCYTLVETHLPDADPVRLREIFRFARQPWPVAGTVVNGDRR